MAMKTTAHKTMTARHAYRLVSAYALGAAILLGVVTAFAPATGWIITVSMIGCFIFVFLTLYLFGASFSANPKRELDGMAIYIIFDILFH
jgi:hypothetical protein